MHFVHFYGVLVFLPVFVVGDETTDCGPDMVTCPSLADCVPPGKCPDPVTEVEDDVPAANQTRVGRWDNGWDDPLHFECPKTGHPIVRIRSYHRNSVEDRRFKFYCSNPVLVPGRYRWFFNVNQLDKYMFFKCPAGGFITGAQSVHSNAAEDRVWSFQCFIPNNSCPFSCVPTDANDWDGWMDYSVAPGNVITTVRSRHDNGKEDRRWTFTQCAITTRGSGRKCYP